MFSTTFYPKQTHSRVERQHKCEIGGIANDVIGQYTSENTSEIGDVENEITTILPVFGDATLTKLLASGNKMVNWSMQCIGELGTHTRRLASIMLPTSRGAVMSSAVITMVSSVHRQACSENAKGVGASFELSISGCCPPALQFWVGW